MTIEVPTIVFVVTIILIGLVLLGVALLFLGITAGFFQKVPYVPSKKSQADLMISLAKPLETDHIVDLGAGHGTLLYEIEARTTCKHLTGFEKAPLPIMTHWFYRIVKPQSTVRVRAKNFFHEDLTMYNVVFLYLLPQVMDELLPKLQKELPRGSKIVSNTFAFSNLAPTKTLTFRDKKGEKTMFLYLL